MNSNVLISIASELDNKGFKQADKSLSKLTKSATKFLGSLALAHKAQKAMLSYMADEKATKVLAQNLKNLNLAYAIPSAEQFIKSMQTQTGILDDELRPAYSQLARVTGSSLETQKLMALAFDVSAGTGQDYASVIDALSKAYVGNNKGLQKLNIGLSRADLSTKSFADITAILNQKFKGSGDASLDSYAGKMALLQVAAADASETIGKSLLDAITQASGPNGFPAFIKSIQSVTNLLSDAVIGTGRLIAQIDVMFSPSKGIGDWFKQWSALRQKWAKEDLAVALERNGVAQNTSSYMEKQVKDAKLAAKIAATQKNLATQQLAAQKKLTAEKAAQNALDKANLALGTAGSIFDLERIGVAAAMQNQTLTDNERKRLEIKQAIFNLEDAIATKDTAKITAATTLLNGLTSQFAIMQKQDALLGQIKTAFDSLGLNKDLINIDNLQKALDLLLKMQGIKISPMTTTTTSTGAPTFASVGNKLTKFAGSAASAFNTLTPAEKDLLGGYAPFVGSNVPPAAISNYGGSGVGFGNNGTGLQVPPQVIVQITDNAQKLVDMVTFATQNNSANGTPVALSRNVTNLAW